MSRLGTTPGMACHVIANPRMIVEGDRATGEVTWVMIGRTADGGPTLAMLGRHEDV
jgi:hypothetical protein